MACINDYSDEDKDGDEGKLIQSIPKHEQANYTKHCKNQSKEIEMFKCEYNHIPRICQCVRVTWNE